MKSRFRRVRAENVAYFSDELVEVESGAARISAYDNILLFAFPTRDSRTI